MYVCDRTHTAPCQMTVRRCKKTSCKFIWLTSLIAFRRISHSFQSYDLSMFVSSGWVSVCVLLSHFVMAFTSKVSPGCICEMPQWCHLWHSRNLQNSSFNDVCSGCVFGREEPAHLRVWTDTGKLLVEFEELNEFRGELGFFCNLWNVVVWTGGKFYSSFFRAKNIKLLFVFQDSNVWITCK